MVPLTAEIKADILDTIGKFADKLYRNIALSYKDLANADPLDMDAPVDLKDPATRTRLCSGHTFVFLAALQDPLREEVPGAIADCTRAGIQVLAPALIGEDPTQLAKLNRHMDTTLKGHPYVKSALDMACWDILGQATGQPICNLLGGRYGDEFLLYRAISQEAPEAMAGKVAGYRAEGYRKFQLKVGGDPETDIERIRAVSAELQRGDVLVADANTGWLMHQAARVVRAVRDIDVYIEQPCETFEECYSIRKLTDHPFVLDENIDGLPILLRANSMQAMDVVNIKISKFGGLTKARQARDLCVSLGIAMTIEDSWGGDIITAAISHLAHSTPTELLFSSTDFNSYVTVSIADGAPQRQDGKLAASTAPGLGITPKMDALGDAVFVTE